MFTYTTCRDCGGLLHTTDGDTVHPGCRQRPTKVEGLTAEWLSAATAGHDQRAVELQRRIDTLDARPPRLELAARQYASWGWPVFPLKPRSKQPATRHGFKDATTDPERIQRWWTRHPDHNIGLPTGVKFDVIDIDAPEGHWSLDAILADENPATGAGDIPDIHGKVMTASAGYHLYVTPSGHGNRAGVLPGVDYRGQGGYVVAPPSISDRGRWTWTIHPSPIITGQGDTYGR